MVLPLSRQKHKRSRSESGIHDVATKKRFRKNLEIKGRKSTSALGVSPSPKKTKGSDVKISISLDGEESVDLSKQEWERYMQLKAVGWTHMISPKATSEPELVRPRTSSLTKLSKKERHMIKKLQSGKRDTSPTRKSGRKGRKQKITHSAMKVPLNISLVHAQNQSADDNPNFISLTPSPVQKLLKRARRGPHKLQVTNANETSNSEMEVPENLSEHSISIAASDIQILDNKQKKRLKKLQAQNPIEDDDPIFISIMPTVHKLPKRARKGLHKLKVTNTNEVEMSNNEIEVPVNSLILPSLIQESETVSEHNKQKKRLKKLQAQTPSEDIDPIFISIIPPVHKLPKRARKGLDKLKVTNTNEVEMSNSEMEVPVNSLIVPPVIQEPENLNKDNNSIATSDTQKLRNKQKKQLKKLQAQNQSKDNIPIFSLITPSPTHKLLKRTKKVLHKLKVTNKEETSNNNGNVPAMQQLSKTAKKGLHKLKVTNTNEEEPSSSNCNVPRMKQLSNNAKEALMKQQKRLEAEGKKAKEDRATNGGKDFVMPAESDGEKIAKITPKTKRRLESVVSVEDVGGKKRRLSTKVGTEKEEAAAVLETKVKQQPKKKRFVLFVGQLPLTSTDVDVKNHFSRAGTVTSVRLIHDKGTNQSRGTGFVEFDNKEAYEKGLSLNHTFLGGRRINVEYTHNSRSHKGKARMQHKNLKLQAMRRTGKLRGSKPAAGKRSARRAKMRNATQHR